MCCLGSHCTLACNATETIPPVRVRRWVRLNPVAPRHTCSYKFHRHDRPAGSDSLVWCWKLLSTAFVVFAAVYTELWLEFVSLSKRWLACCRFSQYFPVARTRINCFAGCVRFVFYGRRLCVCFSTATSSLPRGKKAVRHYNGSCGSRLPSSAASPRPRIPAALKGYRRMKTDWKK